MSDNAFGPNEPFEYYNGNGPKKNGAFSVVGKIISTLVSLFGFLFILCILFFPYSHYVDYKKGVGGVYDRVDVVCYNPIINLFGVAVSYQYEVNGDDNYVIVKKDSGKPENIFILGINYMAVGDIAAPTKSTTSDFRLKVSGISTTLNWIFNREGSHVQIKSK